MACVDLDRQAARQGALPDVCAYCGAPGVARQWMAFAGRTPVTFTVGMGSMVARLPVCGRHRWRTLLRRAIELGMFAAWIACGIVLANTEPGRWAAGLLPYRGGLILAFLATFVAAYATRFVLFYTDVRMTGVTQDVLQLTGVSPQFASACYGETPACEAGDELVALDAAETGESEPIILEEADRPHKQPQLPAADAAGYQGRAVAPRNSAVWFVLPVALLGVLLIVCGGGVAAVWWGLSGRGLAYGAGEPVRLSNPRTSNVMGLATHVQVDCTCGDLPADDAQYALVAEQRGQRITQRAYSRQDLDGAGVLELDVMGSPGGRTVYVERKSASGTAVERVSNVVSID